MNLEQKPVTKAWAATPVCHIRVKSEDGFIQIAPQNEYNPILNELVGRELDAAGIHGLIYQRLIAGFDYDTLTHKRTFRYRRFTGSPNPEKITINLVDGTQVFVIATYDF